MLGYTSTLLLLATFFYLLYKLLTRNYNHWQSRGVPCQKPVIFFGNTWDVVSGKIQVAKFFGKLYSEFTTPYFGMYIFDKPYLVLRNPELIKKILISDFNNFSDRTLACDNKADPICGNSVFLLRNPRWKAVRSKLTSIFTSSKLKFMIPIMQNVGGALESYLAKCDNTVLDIKEVCAKYTTDVTALCFFGFHPNTFEDENNTFRTVGRRMFDFNIPRISFSMFAYFFLPSLVSLLKLSFTDFEGTLFMRRLFESTIHQRKQTNFKRNDFVDLLLGLKDVSNNNLLNFDDYTMVSQAITFYVAGFENTSNLIAFSLYELCVNPEFQDRVRDEIQANLGDAKDITVDMLLNLKFTDMILAETLRKYPLTPFVTRKARDDYYVEETGFTIEKGTEILVPTDGIHSDPNFYPEPEKFIPERFSDEVKYTSDIYLPFGAGPRFCIGDRFSILTAKVGLVCFLRNFAVEICDKTPVPIVLNTRSPFAAAVGGLAMKIKKISTN